MVACSDDCTQGSFVVVALKPRASLLLHWLLLAVPLTLLGLCSCSEPSLDGELTTDFGEVWPTYGTKTQGNPPRLPSFTGTFTTTALEEVYELKGATSSDESGESGDALLAADADPDDNVSLEGAEASPSPPPAAPRITGQKRIITGLIAVLTGVLLAGMIHE